MFWLLKIDNIKKKKKNYQAKYNQNWLLKAKLKLTLIFLKIFRKDLESKFRIPIRIRNPDKEKVYLKMTGKVSASRNVLCSQNFVNFPVDPPFLFVYELKKSRNLSNQSECSLHSITYPSLELGGDGVCKCTVNGYVYIVHCTLCVDLHTVYSTLGGLAPQRK